MKEKLEKNDSIDVTVDSMGSGGEGVAHYNGMALFIPFALKGEKVRAKIVGAGKDYCFARLEEIVSPSPQRVAPPCPHFGKCGGCDLQHYSYAGQLEYKREKVEQALKRIGKCACQVNQVVASPLETRYRNKLSLPVRADMQNRPITGFFAKRSHRIIEVEDCLIQPQWNKPLAALIKKFMTMQKLSAYDEATGKGDIRHISAREIGGTLTLTVVATKDIKKPLTYLYEQLKDALDGQVNLYLNIHKAQDNVILGEETIAVSVECSGAVVDGLKMSVHPKSFFQVNDSIRERLYDYVVKAAKGSADCVIDAYSGAGLMTAKLERYFAETYAVEAESAACESAQRLKQDNGLGFGIICGDCAQKVPELAADLKKRGKTFTVVLDPPKKGCAPQVLEAVSEARRIVYVSCDAATLARDIGILKDKFDVVTVQPFDMFPQTANVETVAVLIKKQPLP